RVLVQTYTPDHPAIRAAVRHDYLTFVQSELPEREKYGVPPFGRLVRLIARGPEESAVFAYLKELAAAVPAGAESSGPHSRAGPGADRQDPQPLSFPHPAPLPQSPAAPGAGAHGAGMHPGARRDRAGGRCRPDPHALTVAPPAARASSFSLPTTFVHGPAG